MVAVCYSWMAQVYSHTMPTRKEKHLLLPAVRIISHLQNEASSSCITQLCIRALHLKGWIIMQFNSVFGYEAPSHSNPEVAQDVDQQAQENPANIFSTHQSQKNDKVFSSISVFYSFRTEN